MSAKDVARAVAQDKMRLAEHATQESNRYRKEAIEALHSVSDDVGVNAFGICMNPYEAVSRLEHARQLVEMSIKALEACRPSDWPTDADYDLF